MSKDSFNAMRKLGDVFFGDVFRKAAELPLICLATGEREVVVHLTRELTPQENCMLPRKCDDVPVVYKVGPPPGALLTPFKA